MQQQPQFYSSPSLILVTLRDILVNGSSVQIPEHVEVDSQHRVRIQFAFSDGSVIQAVGTSDGERLMIELGAEPDEDQQRVLRSRNRLFDSMLTKIADRCWGQVLQVHEFQTAFEQPAAVDPQDRPQLISELSRVGHEIAGRVYKEHGTAVVSRLLEHRPALKLEWRSGLRIVLHLQTDDSVDCYVQEQNQTEVLKRTLTAPVLEQLDWRYRLPSAAKTAA